MWNWLQQCTGCPERGVETGHQGHPGGPGPHALELGALRLLQSWLVPPRGGIWWGWKCAEPQRGGWIGDARWRLHP